jgi:hypothetical protein
MALSHAAPNQPCTDAPLTPGFEEGNRVL